MLRRAFHVAFITLATLALAAAIATCWLWWRSYHSPSADDFGYGVDHGAGELVWLTSLLTGCGGFQFEAYHRWPEDPLAAQKAAAPLPDKKGFFLAHPTYSELPNWTLSLYEESICAYPFGFDDPSARPPRLQFHSDRQRYYGFTETWHGAVIPYWIPLAFFSAIPLLWCGMRLIRNRLMHRLGRGFQVRV